MSNITISKTEYDVLKKQPLAYQKFASKFFESLLIADSIHDVVEDFRSTNLYAEGFIQDLEQGLIDSSYLQITKHYRKS